MEEQKFIDIQKLIASKNPRLVKWIPGFIMRYLKRILHQDEINTFLSEHKDKKDAAFCDEVMKYLNITVVVEGIERIPTKGKVILTMNHPLGGMDAIALVSAIKHHRIDLKYIVNDLLMNLKSLEGIFVGVNKHGRNEKSIREQILDLFSSDSMVCIFPAGLVSRRKKGVVKDLVWKKTFITYAKEFDHTIVPIHIDGELSNFFYNLSSIRTKLGIKANIEMLYLSNELFKQRNKTITFKVGQAIKVADLDPTKTEQELAQIVKDKVYEIDKK